MGASRGIVDEWIAVLRDVDQSDLETLEFLVNQIPDELFWEINEVGGPPIIHKVYAPILASLEREGLIEWTGETAADGRSGARPVRDLTKPDTSRAWSHSKPSSTPRKWLT